jgi:histidinol phosphatase-like PHP family hydrolase
LLTDHHTHLRPDDDPLDEEALSIETIVPHVAAAMDRGLAAVAITEHVYRFRVAKPAWEHPYWETQTQWDIDAYWDALSEAKASDPDRNRVRLAADGPGGARGCAPGTTLGPDPRQYPLGG